jgi:hypothetical protein
MNWDWYSVSSISEFSLVLMLFKSPYSEDTWNLSHDHADIVRRIPTRLLYNVHGRHCAGDSKPGGMNSLKARPSIKYAASSRFSQCVSSVRAKVYRCLDSLPPFAHQQSFFFSFSRAAADPLWLRYLALWPLEMGYDCFPGKASSVRLSNSLSFFFQQFIEKRFFPDYCDQVGTFGMKTCKNFALHL